MPSGTWPEQATQYITKNMLLTGGLNRPHTVQNNATAMLWLTSVLSTNLGSY